MKKSISIFFLSLYLISFTEVNELLKIPQFVKHYQEHKEIQKDLTLYRFVLLHYLNGSQKDQDYKQDMKLPFKSVENHTVMVFQTLPKVFEFHFIRLSLEENNAIFYYRESNTSPSPKPILRPPILS